MFFLNTVSVLVVYGLFLSIDGQFLRVNRDAPPIQLYLDTNDMGPLPEGRSSGENVSSHYRQYHSAAITTDTNICSKIGIDIMTEKGGSAVDAAIASFLCVGLVNAHSSGIGGGHLATIYETPNPPRLGKRGLLGQLFSGLSAKKVMTMTAREMAPSGATRDMYASDTRQSSVGGLSVGVPGEIHGFYSAWQVYGRIPWKSVIEPAIKLCEEGFTVEKSMGTAISEQEAGIRKDPNMRELFVKGDGTLIQAGDLLVNPKLARTFRIIADDPMSFYTGQLAKDIVADLREYGGIITLEDLKSYKSVLKKPIVVSLNNGNFKLYNPPPPSSGAVLGFILNILDGYNFTSDSVASVDKQTLTYHRIAEAFKFAYAKRSQLGDEDQIDVKDLVSKLTSNSYAASIRKQIDDVSTHDVKFYGPTFDLKYDSGTAHMNVLAPDGGAVALTGTINLTFGSRVRGTRTGIIFNDQMDDFSTPGTHNAFGLPASPSNYIAPGKRPMSSMSPTIVHDRYGKVTMLSGASGGSRITTTASFITINSLWFGRDLKTATDTARIHHQLMPNTLVYEKWIDKDVLAGLKEKNHEVEMSYGIATASSIRKQCSNIRWKDACIEAVSDGRKGGTPAGI